jgi:hypothetical protein
MAVAVKLTATAAKRKKTRVAESFAGGCDPGLGEFSVYLTGWGEPKARPALPILATLSRHPDLRRGA